MNCGAGDRENMMRFLAPFLVGAQEESRNATIDC